MISSGSGYTCETTSNIEFDSTEQGLEGPLIQSCLTRSQIPFSSYGHLELLTRTSATLWMLLRILEVYLVYIIWVQLRLVRSDTSAYPLMIIDHPMIFEWRCILYTGASSEGAFLKSMPAIAKFYRGVETFIGKGFALCTLPPPFGAPAIWKCLVYHEKRKQAFSMQCFINIWSNNVCCSRVFSSDGCMATTNERWSADERISDIMRNNASQTSTYLLPVNWQYLPVHYVTGHHGEYEHLKVSKWMICNPGCVW